MKVQAKDVIRWLRTQPVTKRFNYFDGGACLFASFAKQMLPFRTGCAQEIMNEAQDKEPTTPDFWVKYEMKDGEEIVTGSANAIRAQGWIMNNADALKAAMTP